MKFINIIKVYTLLFLITVPNIIWGQNTTQVTTRVLFILDGSSSMLENWSGDIDRFEAGKALVGDIMDSITLQNPYAEFAIRVFGHNYTVDKNQCYDSRLEVDFSPYNKEVVTGRLNYIFPQGVSPIAWSLKQSAESDILQSRKYAYSLILITDGEESCGGDVCDVMQNLINKRIHFTPYIISLNNEQGLVDEYDCMGRFMVVSARNDFKNVIHSIMTDNNYFKATTETAFVPQASYNPGDVKTKDPSIKEEPLRMDTPVVRADTPVSGGMVPGRPSPAIGSLTKMTGWPVPKLRYKAFARPAPGRAVVPKLPDFVFEREETGQAETPDRPVIPDVALLRTDRMTLLPVPPGTQPGLLTRQANLYRAPKTRPVKKLPNFTFPQELTVVETPPVKDNKPKEVVGIPEKEPVKPVLSDEGNVIKTEDKPDQESEGSLQIYFTDGSGRYYRSSPSVEIRNNTTGDVAWKGFRMISQNAPEVISLPDGEYTVVSTKSGRNAQVKIEKGKNKRVEIVVGKGNLSFIHTGTRDVPEGYIATVNKFMDQQNMINHPSEIKLDYEEGNYHIEINTLPTLIYNVDIESDLSTVISIPRPGKVRIMNEEDMGRIEFWHNLAGQPYRFYEMSIFGDVEYQVVDLRPGDYEIRYLGSDPSTGERALKIRSITVKSQQDLEVTLKP